MIYYPKLNRNEYMILMIAYENCYPDKEIEDEIYLNIIEINSILDKTTVKKFYKICMEYKLGIEIKILRETIFRMKKKLKKLDTKDTIVLNFSTFIGEL